MPALKGQKVIITGGGRGLGREIALATAIEGADIVIYYNRSRDKATALVEEISGLGRKAAAMQVEARDLRQIEGVVKEAAGFLGGIDILINNAGVFYKTPIEEAMEAAWDEILDVNLRAPFFFVKTAAPYLKNAGPGRIINIADTYGSSPAAGYVPYGVSKAGLIAMTKGLAKELAPDVLVNCVCPGVIAAPVGAALCGRPCREGTEPLPYRGLTVDRAINATLLKRPVAVDDVVRTVLFLAENNSITGQAIFVDGGK